jgi:hypothetical protein
MEETLDQTGDQKGHFLALYSYWGLCGSHPQLFPLKTNFDLHVNLLCRLILSLFR